MSRGLNPRWESLPAKRCPNCAKIFKPATPWQKFCRHQGNTCRQQYHQHGGAYHKLRPKIEKLVTEAVRREMRPFVERLAELNKAIRN